VKKVLYILIIMLTSSCGYRAYFNLYYNANKYYSTAVKLRKEAAIAGRDTTLVGLTELDSAIVRYAKVIQDHSSSPWIDDAIFMMGNAFLLKGEYQNAITKFEEITKFYTNSKFYSESLLKIGIAYLQRREYSKAIAFFTRAKNVNNKDIAEQALYYEIQTYVLSENYTMAQNKINEFKNIYYESKLFTLILLEEAEMNFKLENWNTLISLYEVISSRIDEQNFTIYYQTTLRFAQALEHLNQLDKSISVLTDLRKIMQTGTKEAEVAIELALCYRLNNDFEKAIQILEEVKKTYPNTKETAKALYYIAEIYEENYEDLQRAQEIYQEVRVSNPDELTAALAMKRVFSLTKIIEYQDALDTISFENEDKLRFLLAELYCFELKNYERADSQYQIIINNFQNSIYYPKSILSIANLLQIEGDSLKADSLYLAVMEQYPLTEYYEYAQNKLGIYNSLEDSIVNEEEIDSLSEQ